MHHDLEFFRETGRGLGCKRWSTESMVEFNAEKSSTMGIALSVQERQEGQGCARDSLGGGNCFWENSPNTRASPVMIMVTASNPSEWRRGAAVAMLVAHMFTILFPTRRVVIRREGLSRRKTMSRSRLLLLFRSWRKRTFEMAVSAVSEAEKKAERINSSTSAAIRYSGIPVILYPRSAVFALFLSCFRTVHER